MRNLYGVSIFRVFMALMPLLMTNNCDASSHPYESSEASADIGYTKDDGTSSPLSQNISNRLQSVSSINQPYLQPHSLSYLSEDNKDSVSSKLEELVGNTFQLANSGNSDNVTTPTKAVAFEPTPFMLVAAGFLGFGALLRRNRQN